MPPSNYLPPEAEFLRQFIPEWIAAQGLQQKKKLSKGEISERNRLVRRVIEQFYVKFPKRDSYQTDDNSLTYDADTRELFPKRLRDWFTNHSNPKGSSTTVKIKTTRSTINARTLAMQKYATEIGAIAQRIRSENSSLSSMGARNAATTEFLNMLQKNQPNDYAKLEDLAEKIRSQGNIDYAEQSQEALEQMIYLFPAKVNTQVEEWGRTVPAHILCIIAMVPPGQSGLSTWTSTSKMIQPLQRSAKFDALRDNFLQVLEDGFGQAVPGRISTAQKAVHPDPAGTSRPMMPLVDNVKNVKRITLREWLRVYFNYLWRWQGGKGSVPWSRLKAKLQHYVDTNRLPPGVTNLRDPHHMLRAELEELYTHITAGQLGKLPQSKVFQFLRVDNPDSDMPLLYETLCCVKLASSTVRYAPEEKLYSIRVGGGQDDAGSQSSWNGLPLLRLYEPYRPFDPDTQLKLEKAHCSERPFGTIIKLLKEMELLGPVHTIDPDPAERLNAHFPANFLDEDIRSFLGTQLLPAAFFDVTHSDHEDFSFAALILYLRSPNRFIHSRSGTARGGPKGIRWVVAVAARIHTTLSIARYPDRLHDDLRAVINPMNLEQAVLQLQRLCRWLIEQLRGTITILRKTADQRGKAWKQAVVSAHLKNKVFEVPSEEYFGPLITSGVPCDPRMLASHYERIMEENPDITLGSENDLQVRADSDNEDTQLNFRARPGPIRSTRTRRMVHSDSGSQSAEEFDLDVDFSETVVSDTDRRDLPTSSNLAPETAPVLGGDEDFCNEEDSDGEDEIQKDAMRSLVTGRSLIPVLCNEPEEEQLSEVDHEADVDDDAPDMQNLLSSKSFNLAPEPSIVASRKDNCSHLSVLSNTSLTGMPSPPSRDLIRGNNIDWPVTPGQGLPEQSFGDVATIPELAPERATDKNPSTPGITEDVNLPAESESASTGVVRRTSRSHRRSLKGQAVIDALMPARRKGRT
ncbi:glycoside hydrolase family 15 protein [Ceratobasidium sp. AG-Ba]|nr:glycoside hydrolase family 15 protein [Ceratobasidium sp. AG-Ba]